MLPAGACRVHFNLTASWPCLEQKKKKGLSPRFGFNRNRSVLSQRIMPRWGVADNVDEANQFVSVRTGDNQITVLNLENGNLVHSFHDPIVFVRPESFGQDRAYLQDTPITRRSRLVWIIGTLPRIYSLKHLVELRAGPVLRNPPQRRVLELFRGQRQGSRSWPCSSRPRVRRSWSKPARTCLSFAITASVFAIASSTVSSTVCDPGLSGGGEE